jgi:GDP-4-dehydro-6-deoxy-D-mannose reductase
MVKKILITGATGFVGIHLLNELINSQNVDLYGTYHSESSLENINAGKDKVKLTKLDLQDSESVNNLIQKVKPDTVYHLAASTSAAASFKSPMDTILNNIASEINLLEAVKNNELIATKILIVSSAEVYGDVEKEYLPINEDTPLNPINPYAVSKAAGDLLAYQYYKSAKLPIVRVRPFTHIGPGQKTGFVTSDFAKQIAEIEKGQIDPVIKVGNLEAKRDFTDVRDVVKAYALLIDKGKDGEVYNVGSGKSHKISEVLEFFLSRARVKIKFETDPKKLRPSDIPDFIADFTKLNQLTGWKPEIPFEKSLEDILDYWRKQV